MAEKEEENLKEPVEVKQPTVMSRRMTDIEIASAFHVPETDATRIAVHQIIGDAIEAAQSQVIHRANWTNYGTLVGLVGHLEGLLYLKDEIAKRYEEAHDTLVDNTPVPRGRSY